VFKRQGETSSPVSLDQHGDNQNADGRAERGFKMISRTRKLLAGVACAGTLTGAGSAATPQVEAATCVYYVKVFAYVRENPRPHSVILKSKSAFSRVTGPCHSRNGFIAVYTSAANDGIGWIDRSKLHI
jgi:hypothetical protein